MQEGEVQRLANEREIVFSKKEAIETEIDRVINTSHSLDMDRNMLKVDIVNQEESIEKSKRDIKAET